MHTLADKHTQPDRSSPPHLKGLSMSSNRPRRLASTVTAAAALLFAGAASAHEVAQKEECCHRGADLDDKHHRIARLPARVQFFECIGHRARNDPAIEERSGFRSALQAAFREHVRTTFLAA